MVRVFTNGPVKWNNPGKGVAPSSALWCSSYRKGSLLVTFDNGRQLYFYLLFIEPKKLIQTPVLITEQIRSIQIWKIFKVILLEEFFWDAPQFHCCGYFDLLYAFKMGPVDDPLELEEKK